LINGSSQVEAREGLLLLAVLSFALVFAVAGCATNSGTDGWGERLSEAERTVVRDALSEKAARELVPLSEVFYARITSRRFNSRATFEDPSVRQFFPTVAAYSDYYAALVDDLDRAYIQYNRPTRVELLGIEVSSSGNLLLELRFVGQNDLPLRWWTASLVRKDEWTWQDERWFVVPGKV
jgi:hypothetical protein